MEGNDWIKDLKVGDKVVTSSSYRKSISTVTTITPKGFIKTDSGHTFNANGGQRGGDTWHRTSLYQLTDKVVSEFKKVELIGKCNNIKFSELTIGQLEQILSIVDKEDAE